MGVFIKNTALPILNIIIPVPVFTLEFFNSILLLLESLAKTLRTSKLIFITNILSSKNKKERTT